MAREAKLFARFKGSPTRALPYIANIPPNWIDRARDTRKGREANIGKAMKDLQRLRKDRPKAAVTIRAAEAELKTLLKDWEVSYQKESFYNGLRVLLELSRDGKSER